MAKANFNYGNKYFDLGLKNPCDGIDRLPEDENIKFIPAEEMIVDVKNRCNIKQRELIDFVYETAARINEAIALEYNDVREDYVILYTRKSRNSKRVPRFLPRPSFIKPEKKGSVFKEWTAYPRFLEVAVKELKQPRWNWHGLRHRRASIWANQGMPLIQIMAYLGHRQIQTTQRYLHSLGIVRL